MKSKNLLAKFRWSGLLLVLAIAVMPSVSWAALNAYMTLTGETQGVIQGSVTEAGREDSILVIGMGHTVILPYDAATGLPTGKPQHRPIRIVKEIDKSSPILFTVLTTNENLTDVTIRFWQPGIAGSEENYYTIQLINAKIVSIMPNHSSVLSDSPDVDPDPMTETVTFVYQKIIVTWEEGGITSEADWNQ